MLLCGLTASLFYRQKVIHFFVHENTLNIFTYSKQCVFVITFVANWYLIFHNTWISELINVKYIIKWFEMLNKMAT